MNLYDLAKLMNIEPSEDLFVEIFPISDTVFVYRFANRERPLMVYTRYEAFVAHTGMIVLWPGAIADIPAGWALCDGSNGTPDLRNRFVVGAPEGDDPGGVGGAAEHDHVFTGDGHTHFFTGDGHTHPMSYALSSPDTGPKAAWDQAAHSDSGQATGQTASSDSNGTTETKDHLPPYIELAFIIKL